MNYGPLVFLAAFFALASSWFGLVLTPQMQVGRLPQGTNVSTGVAYPLARPGLAREGLEVYRANGCAYCHSQQVRQTGTLCDVLLAEPGTNQMALLAALTKVRPDWAKAEPTELLAGLPKPVLEHTNKAAADSAASALKAAGAKSELWVVPLGPDIERGWGKRRSVAEDFVFDSTVMLGSQRIGPDLANVGARLPDANWHLLHLYAPRLTVPNSTMPPFRFLFEKRRIERGPSPDALNGLGELAPAPGYEIIPTREAKALAAYLLSLRADAPLFETPLTVPAAPAAETATNATPGAASTNAPPK
jgi:hypothetical protein